MRTTFVRFVILLIVLLLEFGKACGPSEYKSPVGECCPMCSIGYAYSKQRQSKLLAKFCDFSNNLHLPLTTASQKNARRTSSSMNVDGSVVNSDCSGDLSTTCKPCAPGTFISEPNGLHKCFICKTCAEGKGLYIKSKCTTIQDTFCDVLDGYYCIELFNSQCLHAQKHSVCKPGQEIKTPGTKNSDTVCVDCPPGFYSPSGLNCTKWTDCTARNEIEAENGSSVKDVTCSTKSRKRYGLIIAVVLTSFLGIILYLVSQITSRKVKYEESTSANTTQRIHNSPEENNEEQ